MINEIRVINEGVQPRKRQDRKMLISWAEKKSMVACSAENWPTFFKFQAVRAIPRKRKIAICPNPPSNMQTPSRDSRQALTARALCDAFAVSYARRVIGRSSYCIRASGRMVYKPSVKER